MKRTKLNALERSAMADCIKKALQAKPTVLHSGLRQTDTFDVYEIDGEIFSMEAALDKIAGKYSWYQQK